MSTLYALPIYAKKTCMGLLCTLGMVFLTTAAFSQTIDLQTELDDLSGKSWKSGPALTTTITQEKTTSESLIVSLTTHPDDVLIQTFYQKVLDRLGAKVQSGMAVSDALHKAFDETAAEAVNHPTLRALDPSTAYSLMHILVERLQEVPVFVPATN